MADIPRSSFIPKETSGAVPSRIKRRRTFHVFGFLASVLLIGSLALAAGTYFYKKTAEKARDNTQEELRLLKDQFDEKQVAEVRQFDRQLKAAEFLLNNHIAPTKIFTVLERSTKQRVQFMDFGLEYDPSFDVTVSLSGGTEEFMTVALQALQFGSEPLLRDALFSEVSSEGANIEAVENPVSDVEDHEVTFAVSGTVAPSLLLYDGIYSVGEVRTEQTEQNVTNEQI